MSKSMQNRQVIIAVNVVVVFLYWVAQYLFMPTLPVYVQSKTDNLAMVGVVLSMYGLWQAIIRLPLGIASDWVGWRKPFIIACLGLLGVGIWLMGTASGVGQLLIGRVLTGVAAGCWVLLLVNFTSLFPPEEAVRATALMSIVNSVGRFLATGVTGMLNTFQGYLDYTPAFLLAAGIAWFAGLALLPLKENHRAPQRPTLHSITTLILRPDVLLPSLLGALLQYMVWSTTFGFLPLLARQFGATDILQSTLVSMNVALGVLGGLITSILIKRLGVYRLVVFTFISVSGGVGLAAIASSLAWVFVAQFVMGCGVGVGYPVLMGLSIRYVAEVERTTAMGLHQAVYAIGMFAGPWLSGIIAAQVGVPLMFGATGLICLVLGLLGTIKLSKVQSHA